MQERRRWQPPEKESEDPKIYVKREEKISSDKGSHKKRSIANDDRKKGHRWFWQKEENKL